MRQKLQQAIGGALLLWSLAVAASGLQATLALGRDPMAQLDAEFRVFAPYLPPVGVIGYLEGYVDGGSPEAVRMHYAAQYSLAPRVVVGRIEGEFLIVARGAARPDGDPRLDGFHLVAEFPGGHRLFRRGP